MTPNFKPGDDVLLMSDILCALRHVALGQPKFGGNLLTTQNMLLAQQLANTLWPRWFSY